jgi:hypothetical protein
MNDEERSLLRPEKRPYLFDTKGFMNKNPSKRTWP